MMNALKQAVGVWLVAVGIALAQEPPAAKPTLHVGDPAPALAPGKWLKGEPVAAFEPGKVYVVEFWATWCPPCRASIPHLTELQAKYKDQGVIVIGQNTSEKDPNKVAEFVKKMGDKMNYRVALDDKAGTMSKTWMQAAGQEGIPTAFIVDKTGKVAWIGHPMAAERVLAKIMAGNFDARAEAAKAEKIQKDEEALSAAMQRSDYDQALKLADDLLALNPDEPAEINGAKFQILLRKKDYPAAYALGAKLAEELKDTPAALNELAWTIVAGEGIEKHDLDLAEKMASRANEVLKGAEPAVLDTLARVYFEKGEVAKAIETQTQAVAKANADAKPALEETLNRYKAARK